MEPDSISDDLQDMVVQQVIEIAESQLELEVPFDDGVPSGEEIQVPSKMLQPPPTPPPLACSTKEARPAKIPIPRRIKPKLLDALGYTYNIKRIRSHGLTDWQCTVRGKSFACRATVKQKKGSFHPGPQPHLHMADPVLDQIDSITSKHRRPRKLYREGEMLKAALPAVEAELFKTNKQKDKKSQNMGSVTHYGKPRLLDKSSGFVYLIKSASDSVTNWQCIFRSTSLKCPAVLKQRRGEFTFGHKSHCHEGRVKLKQGKEKASIVQEHVTPADDRIGYEQSLEVEEEPVSVLSEETLALGYRVMEASSQRSGPRLVDAHGYTYNIKRLRGPTTDWQCSIRNKKVRCPAYVKERDGVITPGPQGHIHAPKPGSVIKSIVSAKIKAQAIANVLQPAMDIVNEVLTQEGPQKLSNPDLKPVNLARMAHRLRDASKKKYINSIVYGIAEFHAGKAGEASGDSEDSDHE